MVQGKKRETSQENTIQEKSPKFVQEKSPKFVLSVSKTKIGPMYRKEPRVISWDGSNLFGFHPSCLGGDPY